MLLENNYALPEARVARTIRAARYHGNKDIRVEDVPTPALKPGTALVEVEWCGICGSDLHEYLAGTFRSIRDSSPQLRFELDENMPSLAV